MLVFIAFLSSTRPMWCLMGILTSFRMNTRQKFGTCLGSTTLSAFGIAKPIFDTRDKSLDLSRVYNTLRFLGISTSFRIDTSQKFGTCLGSTTLFAFGISISIVDSQFFGSKKQDYQSYYSLRKWPSTLGDTSRPSPKPSKTCKNKQREPQEKKKEGKGGKFSPW